MASMNSPSDSPAPSRQEGEARPCLVPAVLSAMFMGFKASISFHKSILYLFASRTTSSNIL